MPNQDNVVNFSARIDPEAKHAFDSFCLELIRLDKKQWKDHEVMRSILILLSREHVRIVLKHALLQTVRPAKSGSTNFASRIPFSSKLAFDEFAHEFKRMYPVARFDYQVIEGLCFALELPYVRELLLPLLRRTADDRLSGPST